MQFIEDSFVSKSQLIDDSTLQYLIDDKKNIEITDKYISFADLDVTVFILSGKSYMDLVSKDFAKNYHNSLKIYQNEMGFFNKFQKILESNGNGQYRVFIKYNKIVSENNKHYLRSELRPVPVLFRSNSVANQKLQVAFNVIKSLTLRKIYKNNYAKHCVNKIVVNGEELIENENENETNINLCVIALEHENNVNFFGLIIFMNKNLF
jgi:hypothetical protein